MSAHPTLNVAGHRRTSRGKRLEVGVYDLVPRGRTLLKQSAVIWKLLDIKGRKEKHLYKYKLCANSINIALQNGNCFLKVIIFTLRHLTTYNFKHLLLKQRVSFANILDIGQYCCPPVKQLISLTCCINRKQLLIYVSLYSLQPGLWLDTPSNVTLCGSRH